MTLPFAISLAHCTHRIPREIRPSLALSEEAVRESVDLGTEEIFGKLPARAVLRAAWSRLVVDLNRSSRARGPRGVIAEVDYHGRTIYREGCFPNEEALIQRLSAYYWPYHKRLRKTLEDPGILALWDCHSLDSVGPARAPDTGASRKDIVLGNNGDLHGAPSPVKGVVSCPSDILFWTKECFERSGFSVNVNYPYSGGYIVTRYGRLLAKTGRIALQIEINQALYLESKTRKPVQTRLREVRNRLEEAFARIAKDLGHCLRSR